jgi:phthalate 4,5-dioxygenase oxygenase subunit
MLTAEENELLCRVEGDAPMGQLMRRHWIPACLSEELPEPDGTPVPVRLLGEDLVAWRDSDGRVGLMDRHCLHRRASMVLARNEEGGLRCLYHGWKYDIDGNVLEMPSEPPESDLRHKIKQKTYPTHEHGGFVWAYMGPRESMPEFEPPPFAPTADTKVSILKIQTDCNWAQVVEGDIDSSHSSTLHSSDMVPSRDNRTKRIGSIYGRPTTDKNPRIQVQRTHYGFKYAAIRRPISNADINDYVRMTVYVAPFFTLIPPYKDYNLSHVLVPVDDTHTMFHSIAWSESPTGGRDQEEWRKFSFAQVGIDVDAHYRKIRTLENNYLQDRQAMKNGSFTGIRGISNQDIAMTESMGPITDRTSERLGASDQAIVEFRRTMVEEVSKFRDGGPALGTRQHANSLQVPYMPHGVLRSFEGMLVKGTDWRNLDTVDAQEERAAADSLP